jgi:predicted alpha/beta-hydrolase family hydrolase
VPAVRRRHGAARGGRGLELSLELETPHGPARAHLHPVDEPRAALVLGHGAGGGVAARDLVAATRAANAAGVSVALVEQPYRVAGRRSPPRAPVLDADWTAVVEQLAGGPLRDLPLIAGGRSSGARVACRTAQETGAIAVLCLAFPLVAPSGTSRQEELDGAGVPVLVVQGASDRFGLPEPSATRTVVVVTGDHGLRSDAPAVTDAVAGWLPAILAGARGRPAAATAGFRSSPRRA